MSPVSKPLLLFNQNIVIYVPRPYDKCRQDDFLLRKPSLSERYMLNIWKKLRDYRSFFGFGIKIHTFSIRICCSRNRG